VETIRASIYDFPKYYDLLFGSDCRAEYHFIRGCFERHAGGPVRRVFEPACGTGRLLVRFARAGYEVAGLDLNPKAVAYCNARLRRQGLPAAAVVGDMAHFRVRRKCDAAFNTINSFRHLATEDEAQSHLRCVARALGRGGIYILGLHLTPTRRRPCSRESWSARRGHLAVTSEMRSIGLDRGRRTEHIRFTLHIYTPTRRFRLEDEFTFRTYTMRQFNRLLGRITEFEVAETYDFHYDLRRPIRVDQSTEDVVYVLRKR